MISKNFRGHMGSSGLKLVAVILAGLFCLYPASSARAAEAPPIEWVRQFGSLDPANDFAMAIDGNGNMYIAGYTSSTFPGQASAGGYDAFIRKYNADGTEVWTRQFGTSYDDCAWAIAADFSGVYIAGYTSGTFPDQTNSGGYDAFVRKYDASGTEAWTRQFGTDSYDCVYGIVADSAGVYATGYTGGTFPEQTSSGRYDAFVRRYDASGTEVWTRQFGTSLDDRARGISVDTTGIYIAGYTSGTFPGQTSAGGADVFLVKITEDNIPPTVTITAPVNGAYYQTASVPSAAYTVIDNVDAHPSVVATGWSNTEGTHMLVVTATDATGNTGSASVTYTVDNHAPSTASVLADPNPAMVNSSINLVATVTDAGAATSYVACAEYSIDAGPWTPMTAKDGAFDEMSEDAAATITFAGAGLHYISVRGTDAAGNIESTKSILIVLWLSNK